MQVTAVAALRTIRAKHRTLDVIDRLQVPVYREEPRPARQREHEGSGQPTRAQK